MFEVYKCGESLPVCQSSKKKQLFQAGYPQHDAAKNRPSKKPYWMEIAITTIYAWMVDFVAFDVI